MEFCACSGSLSNTGTPNKQRIAASGVRLVVVPIKADDGTFNQILATDTINEAYLQARLNDEDESKRWYPIGEFRNQEDIRADATTETLTSGENILTQQGLRTYTGWLINYAPVYIKALKSFRCRQFGVFVINDCGGLEGSITKDGTALRPIRVNKDNWNPTYVKKTPTTSAKVQLDFEFSQLEVDEDLRVIAKDEITADLLDAEGLLPIKGTVVGTPTTTGFVTSLTVDYDILVSASQEVVPGWLLADFALFNKTINLAVVPSSVTESPEGTYTFVIPAQSASDVLELTNLKTAGTKPGFALKQQINIP